MLKNSKQHMKEKSTNSKWDKFKKIDKHIIVKILIVRDKWKMLKAAREK